MDNLYGWAAVIVAITGMVKIWYDVRNVKTDIGDTRTDVKEVHKIVNSERTAMRKEINALRKLITTSVATDKPVPPNKGQK